MLTEHIVKNATLIYCSVSCFGWIMTEPVLLFRNRMGLTNWGLMALGFALAVPLVVAEGASWILALSISGGLALFAIMLAGIAILFMGRTNVAELTLRGAVLDAEMLSPFGRGRLLQIPLGDAADWRVTKTWPSVRFRYGASELVLPLHGAKVDWPALRQVAPDMREVLK